jgi:ribosomal protein L32E
MLPTKFRFIWPSGFRGEDFLEINQLETRIVCGGHVCKRIGTKLTIFIEDLPRMLPTKFRFIWPSGFRGEYVLVINQSETRIACGGHVC